MQEKKSKHKGRSGDGTGEADTNRSHSPQASPGNNTPVPDLSPVRIPPPSSAPTALDTTPTHSADGTATAPSTDAATDSAAPAADEFAGIFGAAQARVRPHEAAKAAAAAAKAAAPADHIGLRVPGSADPPTGGPGGPLGVGDGGASWRMKALKRAQERAAAEGGSVAEEVQKRFASLGDLTGAPLPALLLSCQAFPAEPLRPMLDVVVHH